MIDCHVNFAAIPRPFAMGTDVLQSSHDVFIGVVACFQTRQVEKRQIAETSRTSGMGLIDDHGEAATIAP